MSDELTPLHSLLLRRCVVLKKRKRKKHLACLYQTLSIQIYECNQMDSLHLGHLSTASRSLLRHDRPEHAKEYLSIVSHSAHTTAARSEGLQGECITGAQMHNK